MVDFSKLLSDEDRKRLADRKESIAKFNKRHRSDLPGDFLAAAMHCYHNASCTLSHVGVNGFDVDSSTYDSALVFLYYPTLIRLMATSHQGDAKCCRFLLDCDRYEKREIHQIKCLMEGCTGYYEYPRG